MRNGKLIGVISIFVVGGLAAILLFLFQNPKSAVSTEKPKATAQTQSPDQIPQSEPLEPQARDNYQTSTLMDKAASVNSAFRTPTRDELARVKPVVDDKFFANGKPQLYSRHRVLAVNVNELKDQLQSAAGGQTSTTNQRLVPIPLFDDQVISVDVQSWSEGSFNSSSVYGEGVAKDGSRRHVSFNFFQDGSMFAGLSTPQKQYVIVEASENTYYVIMESRHVESID